MRAPAGAAFDEAPVAVGDATCALAEGACASCAKSGGAEAMARPNKLTAGNEKFFIGGMLVTSR